MIFLISKGSKFLEKWWCSNFLVICTSTQCSCPKCLQTFSEESLWKKDNLGLTDGSTLNLILKKRTVLTFYFDMRGLLRCFKYRYIGTIKLTFVGDIQCGNLNCWTSISKRAVCLYLTNKHLTIWTDITPIKIKINTQKAQFYISFKIFLYLNGFFYVVSLTKNQGHLEEVQKL